MNELFGKYFKIYIFKDILILLKNLVNLIVYDIYIYYLLFIICL